MKNRKNGVNLVVGIIISLLLNSCITASLIKSTYLICDERRVKIYELPENNPTSYILHYSKQQVVDQILNNRIQFKGYHSTPLHKKNEIDTLILNSHSYAFNLSYIYRHPKGYGKYYRYYSVIEISALSDSTSFIRVTMKEPTIYVGVATMFYPIFVEHVWQNFEPTTPTTIEEYEIIRYIGRSLGEKGMPKVKYPPQLTEWEIKANLLFASPRKIHKKKNKLIIQKSIESEKKYIDLVLGDD